MRLDYRGHKNLLKTCFGRFFENIFFDGVDADESINVNCFSLSNSMATILGLFIHGWIPVSIIEDDAVSTCKIDSNTSTSSGRNETKDLLVKVKPIHKLLSILSLD